MLDDIFNDAKKKMVKNVDALKRHLSTMRTGRASPSLVSDIRVDCYGEKMPLSQLATISIPESGLIVIQPWDPTVLKDIENSILRSGNELTPASDGNVIRIAIPPLSEERRKKLGVMAAKNCEEGRAALRNVRKEIRNQIRDLEKQKDVSEDEASIAYDDLQKMTDEFIAQIDEIQEAKQKELMEF
ncbi:MAG: ribosome recycling factor [Candidatus Coatesbacteria bacterium]|nr:ribosome recycling factor [Candidatus Coatesbacteria bacterium]